MIQNSPTHDGNLSTWDKAKDAALIGFLALASVALVKLMGDVSELKTAIAVYQAQSEAVRSDVVRLQNTMDAHLREDRERFRAVIK